jgi:hypothetical protein
MGNVPSSPKFDVRGIQEIAGPRFDQRIYDNFKGDDGKITRDRVLALDKHHTSAEILFILAGKATRDKGEVVLLDADWLIEWYEAKKVQSKFVALPCRQELPSGAFVFARTCNQEETDICFISYPWYTLQHPDPLGFHLSVVVPVLKLYQKLKQKKLAVFWDWCSLHQAYFPPSIEPPPDYFGAPDVVPVAGAPVPAPDAGAAAAAAAELEFAERTPQQQTWYDRGLSTVGDWLVNNTSLVLIQSHQAEDPEGFKLQVDMRDIMPLKDKDKDPDLNDDDQFRKKLFERFGIKLLDDTVLVEDVKATGDGHKGGVRSGFFFAGIGDGTEDTMFESITEIVKELKVYIASVRKQGVVRARAAPG